MLRLLLALCIAGPAAAQIVSADYIAPTMRYPHAVLGDGIEYGALRLGLADGSEVVHTLPDDRVFEDLEPRLFDVGGDGDPEVIVVEAHARQGAQLAIYDEGGKAMATPHIGIRFRWLAPIAAADLDGDGAVEIAYIETPHLGKTLRIWRVENGDLTLVASAAGLTNHRIGEAFITSTLRDCGVPTLITVDARWRNIVASRLVEGEIVSEVIAPYEGFDSVMSQANCD